MKKVMNINLGGHPITIDEDAFIHLDQYLKAVDRSFRNLDGHDEILQDIEIRIAELLQEQLKNRVIVTMADVQAIILIMGKPEEFAEDRDPGGAHKESHQSSSKESFTFRPGKKLFRDTEDKVIGGVCSGLSAYLGIPDPVWVRLAFVLLLVSGGFGALIYIVLLIIVPKAETSADRLAMRGEPVNITTIAQAVEKQFEEISDKLNELGEDFRRKKK